MKKQILIKAMKNVFLVCVMLTIGSLAATAQDTATIRIDKAKAKDAYNQNSEGRKATAQGNSTNRRTTFKQNQPARQETATQNKQERKVATSDGAVTTEEAQTLYQNNSQERRANAKDATPARKETATENSAARKSQVRTAVPKRRAAVIR